MAGAEEYGAVILGILVIAVTSYIYVKKPAEPFQDLTTILDPTKTYTIPFYTPRKKSIATKINNVPLVIYETWHDRNVPEGMKNAITSLLNTNPEFDYYLYSDDDCVEFIQNNFDDEVATAFKTLKPGAYKSDLWRYCILYINGGVYLDVKYLSTNVTLLSIIRDHSEVYVRDIWPDGICTDGLYNGFMISPPGNEVFNDCIKDIVISTKNNLYRRNLLDVTGPCLLGRMLKKYKTKVYLDNNPFHLVKSVDGFDVDGIKKYDTLILKHYKTYRMEQRIFQKTLRYGDMYANKDIYVI